MGSVECNNILILGISNLTAEIEEAYTGRIIILSEEEQFVIINECVQVKVAGERD